MPAAVPRVIFTCETCGGEFKRLKSAGNRASHPIRYCSIKCRGLGMRNRITLTCLECRKEFERGKSEVSRHSGSGWCSRRCWKKWQEKRRTSYPKIGERHAHRVVM